MTKKEKIEYLAKAVMTLSELGDGKTAYALNEIRLELKGQLGLPEGLEEAAMRDSLDYVDSIPDGGTDKHPWNDHDVEKAYYDGMLSGAEWQKKRDDLETADLLAIAHLQGMEQQKAKMMEKAVDGRYMKADGKVYVESWPLDIDPDSVKAGDEVRLIVIPKED